MVININPNRINTNAGKSTDRKRDQGLDVAPVVVPRRATENYIPASESLRTLISSAVEALRRGVTWDRGTILNIVA